MKGFLGYQPLFMIDFVLVAQLLIVPLIALALFLAKKGNYKCHARLMTVVTLILLVAVVLFETEIRLHGGMSGIAKMVGKVQNVETGFFKGLFFLHLLICGLVSPLWIYTIYKGVKNFGFKNPESTSYGKTHRILAKISLVGVLLIALTGIGCYYYAFVV